MPKDYPADMFDLAYTAMKKAYMPYSKFSVGACVKDENGNLYTGCNVENVSYSLTLCAEAVALGNLVVHGGKRITEVVIVASSDTIISPCGACRQRFREFCAPGVKIHMFNQKGNHKMRTIGELLPESFDTENMI
ncbi:MAG: cytidine deaminase [Gammaproteobacteria bacterium]|nr:cytidine deaminase [Gammaproteobacteria bacterium]